MSRKKNATVDVQAPPDYDAVELNSAKTILAEFLAEHWRGILASLAASGDDKMAVNIGLTLDHSDAERHLKVKISYGIKTKDAAETTVPDPSQQELPL